MFKRISLFVLTIVSLFLLSACNYKLAGTMQPLPFRTIAVKQVVNASYSAQTSAPLTNQISKMLLQSPALELVGVDDAQAILEVEIVDYSKRIYATKSEDTELASANLVSLTARATLKDVRHGTIIFQNKEFKVDEEILMDGGSLNNEYTAVPNITERLSRKIVDSVLGIW